MTNYRVLSLFSGMGGMDIGFAEQVVVHRNSISNSDYIDSSNEITPEFVLNNTPNGVEVSEVAWVVKDDNGVDCQSLLAPAGFVSFVHQIHKAIF